LIILLELLVGDESLGLLLDFPNCVEANQDQKEIDCWINYAEINQVDIFL